jgi:hypothetical protein
MGAISNWRSYIPSFVGVSKIGFANTWHVKKGKMLNNYGIGEKHGYTTDLTGWEY